MAEAKEPKTLKFDYIKSNFFRVVHGDGVFGGVTPRGDIWATFFSERGAIPTQITHEVTEGTLGSELRDKRVVRDAIVREAEVAVVMDISAAKSLVKWLGEKVDAIEQVQQKEKQ